jgi:hypothetical protein
MSKSLGEMEEMQSKVTSENNRKDQQQSPKMNITNTNKNNNPNPVTFSFDPNYYYNDVKQQ